MLFKSWRIVLIQFFLGLPGFQLTLWSACQYIACFGILLSPMRSTCPSHLSLLSLMMRFNSSNFVCWICGIWNGFTNQLPSMKRTYIDIDLWSCARLALIPSTLQLLAMDMLATAHRMQRYIQPASRPPS